MKNRIITILAALSLVALVAAVGYGAYGYVRISPPLPGVGTTVTVKPIAIGVAKVVAIEAIGVVSNTTIEISTITPPSTNPVVRATKTVAVDPAAPGNQVFDLSSSGYFWLMEGEHVQRGGTSTNGVVRLIYEN